jgi:glycosyltransferase involved in cell wall biosynthesis
MAAVSTARAARVLFVSGLQIHPPVSGGNLRSRALVDALGRRGLEVFVYSLMGRKKEYLAWRPSGLQVWPQGAQEYVDRRLTSFAAQYTSYALDLPPLWMTAYLRAAAASPRESLLPAVLRERLAWCDVVVADFPFVHPVFHAPSGRGRLRVLSTHNLEHQMYDGQEGWKSRRLRRAVRRLELRAAEASDIVVSCCTEDRQFFEANARVRRSILVPNGIDPRRFAGLESHRARTRQALGLAEDVKVFLFTASKYRPNREAFEFLSAFARAHAPLLVSERIHILVVGNLVARPLRLPGFTATGRVDEVEPYFAAADAALNPLATGAGTNVKMCEFIATRLPLVSTHFGARGFALEDGETAFLFERPHLAAVLTRVRRLFDQDPGRLRHMAEAAFARNQRAIDMDRCVQPLAEAMSEAREGRAPVERAEAVAPAARQAQWRRG